MRLYGKCIKVSTVFICVHFTIENTLAFEDGYCMKDCRVSNHGRVNSIGEYLYVLNEYERGLVCERSRL